MATSEKVLIVEDEPHALTGLAELVSGWGYRTETARDGMEALEKVNSWVPGIIVTDLKMPRMDGLQLLQQLGEMTERQTVIVLTAQGSIERAVEAMKLGAYDFIQKPVEPPRLKSLLASATHKRASAGELEATRSRLRQAGALGSLVGKSKQMQDIFSLIERVAPSTVSVLITGESGTGKEVVARTLHDLSPRRSKPFVAVNCAAIPETLIESEIFGHEKGSFTGAMERRAGCFELAEEGTLLLDEIGEMPIGTQAKLLRVLEDRKLRRLGSKTEMPMDVRVLAATNKDPDMAVSDGHLRGDLYYRLNVFNIHMPPLRDHKEDIPAIVEAMISEMNARHGQRIDGIDPFMMDRLMDYEWPGNVRELRNTIERALILCGEGVLDVRHLPSGFGDRQAARTAAAFAAATPDTPETPSNVVEVELGSTVDEAERRLIVRTLEMTRNNKTRAADILGISLKTLHNKLKEYGAAAANADAADDRG